MKRTKIVCTIGPASDHLPTLRAMIREGMNVARLNFSHGTYAHHATLMARIREAAKLEHTHVAILQDLQGPKIRVGTVPSRGFELHKGDHITFLSGTETVTKGMIPIPFSPIARMVKKGDHLLLDDGLLEVVVQKVSGKKIAARVMYGGTLLSHKGINVPASRIRIPSLTKKDIQDLEFGIRHDVDLVALSFVQTKHDIVELRKLIAKYEKRFWPKRTTEQRTKIVAKIEKKQGVENFDAILRETDAVMVARGDLGIETPIQDIPLLQKQMIEQCLVAAKPVITATQMLESMTRNPRPTRAEVSDVANAVIDHTDAVMLSAESASGAYPVKAVTMMQKVIHDTEESRFDDLIASVLEEKNLPIDTSISSAAAELAKHVGAKAILIATISGYSARLVARYRPELPIVVAAADAKIARQLALSWGVEPSVVRPCKNVDELISEVARVAKLHRWARKGDRVVIIGGQPVGKAGNVNLVKVHEMK